MLKKYLKYELKNFEEEDYSFLAAIFTFFMAILSLFLLPIIFSVKNNVLKFFCLVVFVVNFATISPLGIHLVKYNYQEFLEEENNNE